MIFLPAYYPISDFLLQKLLKPLVHSLMINFDVDQLFYFQGYNIKPFDQRGTEEKSGLTYHRNVEAFKFAYAYTALLGDQDFTNVTEVL